MSDRRLVLAAQVYEALAKGKSPAQRRRVASDVMAVLIHSTVRQEPAR